MVGFFKVALYQYDHKRKSSMETCQSIRCPPRFGRRYVRPLGPVLLTGRGKCRKRLMRPLDSEVDGMFLPKGSTVVLNVWATHHNSDTWKDPQHFIPERFEFYPSLASTYAALGKWDERDHYGYGAGRRICPGESNSSRVNHTVISYEICRASNTYESIHLLTLPLDSSKMLTNFVHLPQNKY